MNYGGKDRGRDRSSDGSETPQLKEAGASQVRYVLRECEGVSQACMYHNRNPKFSTAYGNAKQRERTIYI